MSRTPIFITAALILVAAGGAAYIACSTSLDLTDAQLVNALIAIAACLGAFITATFVVFSYLQTNRAYVESQRPYLLVQVENLKAKEDDHSENVVPMTKIHYKNITRNRFSDLTMVVHVTAINRSFDLSDLFRAKMTMIGLDSRQSTFNTFTELRRRGLDLQEVATQGNEVRLTIGYNYTFNGIQDCVNTQMYRWDPKREEWSIC